MAIIRERLFSKLNNTLFRSVESATTLCKLRGNPYVELVHWFNQIWVQDTENDFKLIVRYFDIDVYTLESDLARAMARLPSGASSITDFSYFIELAIERAWIYSSLECSSTQIRSGYLLIAMLTTMELRRELLSMIPSLECIALEHLSKDFQYITRDSAEVVDDMTPRAEALPGEASGSLSQQATASLTQYTTDITQLAREGKIDPVVGRSQEISTMVDILLRRRQNNPLLTGEAGVGKTAVVEGLALAIAAGEVPPALAKVRLLILDVVALSAGASMKGEFEARLKAVLDGAMASADPVVLFIDEVHTLIGAGGSAGTGDAANLLKPALARGKLRTIGATTWSEFKRHIEKDPALTRRFQVLQVAEPTEESAAAMLRGLLPVLEKHHGVWITDDALNAAVRLSHRYIPARQLPDKAISLLDTACARVATAQSTMPLELQMLKARINEANAELDRVRKALQFGKGEEKQVATLVTDIAELINQEDHFTQKWMKEKTCVESILSLRSTLSAAAEDEEAIAQYKNELSQKEAALITLRDKGALVQAEVDSDIIATIVADWTGIPAGQMQEDDIKAVAKLPEHLQQRVIGQPQALQQISERILVSRAGLGDPNKPVGVFMLVGSSGVGKTETALALSEALYGGEQNLITINMSEYQEAHTISSLKGAPPGYVGYGEGGVLTEAVRRRPYSVVLLDEIEKAHPDIHELFFQVFDKGWMEDGEGRYIDFKNTVILLTSNVGELIMHQYANSEQLPENDKLLEVLQAELLNVFPAAFLGRLEVVPYNPLQQESLQTIVRLQLNKIARRLQENYQLELRYEDSLLDDIISQCSFAQTGARALIQFIEKQIMPTMGRFVLSQRMSGEQQIAYLKADGKTQFTVSF
ncbi:type VI secretion system ATPase TssH [Serratia sp. S1B]|nr:type VI secretion system ATPase TssH [Serratia sp. S1B]